MYRFHSFGTATGTCEVMTMWSSHSDPTATAISQVCCGCANSRISGAPSSITVPECATTWAKLLGRRSSGNLRYMARLNHFGRAGALLVMTLTTVVKWRVNFDTAAHSQITARATFKPAIIWAYGKRNSAKAHT